MTDKEKQEQEKDDSLHNKYRPRTLDRIIGQERIVTRLKGIIKAKKYRGSMLFVGESSGGKTTMARAFASDVFGTKNIDNHPDYLEINAANARKIEDVRQLLRVATLKPRLAPIRIILMDEVQQWTHDAEQSALKPLENPPPSTQFILCSMEPEKLGKAVKNRCVQYALEAYTKEDILKYVKRIAKGEDMTYLTDETMNAVVENSNGELRSAANIMQSLQDYAHGLDKLPKQLKADQVEEVLGSTANRDQEIAVRALVGVYANKFKRTHLAILDTVDGFRMVKALLYLNTFLLNVTVLEGQKHKSVWWSQQNKDLLDGLKEFSKIKPGKELQAYATVQSALVEMQVRAGAFAVSEVSLISATMFEALQRIKQFMKDKE